MIGVALNPRFEPDLSVIERETPGRGRVLPGHNMANEMANGDHMTTTTLTLTEFLLARIAEDEAVVADWPTEGRWGKHSEGHMWTDPTGQPIYAPRAWVEAQCDAKRGIIAWAERRGQGVSDVRADMRAASRSEVLRILALPYADHPDYRAEWKL